MIAESVITCPRCGTAKTETMPTDSCCYFYECSGCGVLLRPRPGDCCVFCSYGSVACPPIQAASKGVAAKDRDEQHGSAVQPCPAEEP